MIYPSVQGRSDPKVLCGILAHRVLPHLAAPNAGDEPSEQEVISLVNLVRLLDMYRYKVMRTLPKPRGIVERTATSRLSLIPPKSDPFEALEVILENAQQEVYHQIDNREVVVIELRRVLIQLIDGETVDAEEAGHARDFFAACVRQIEHPVRQIEQPVPQIEQPV